MKPTRRIYESKWTDSEVEAALNWRHRRGKTYAWIAGMIGGTRQGVATMIKRETAHREWLREKRWQQLQDEKERVDGQ